MAGSGCVDVVLVPEPDGPADPDVESVAPATAWFVVEVEDLALEPQPAKARAIPASTVVSGQ